MNLPSFAYLLSKAGYFVKIELNSERVISVAEDIVIPFSPFNVLEIVDFLGLPNRGLRELEIVRSIQEKISKFY